jgi:hypothetical protein
MSEPPPRKVARVETEADRREAFLRAMLDAGVPHGRATQIFRARERLDIVDQSTIALSLARNDIPPELIYDILRIYEENMAPVSVVIGAEADSGDRRVGILQYATNVEVSPMSTVREVVEEVQESAALNWTVPGRSDDPWAHLSTDFATDVSVGLFPEDTSPADALRSDLKVGSLLLYDHESKSYIVPPDSKLLTYRGSGQLSPFLLPTDQPRVRPLPPVTEL